MINFFPLLFVLTFFILKVLLYFNGRILVLLDQNLVHLWCTFQITQPGTVMLCVSFLKIISVLIIIFIHKCLNFIIEKGKKIYILLPPKCVYHIGILLRYFYSFQASRQSWKWITKFDVGAINKWTLRLSCCCYIVKISFIKVQ